MWTSTVDGNIRCWFCRHCECHGSDCHYCVCYYQHWTHLFVSLWLYAGITTSKMHMTCCLRETRLVLHVPSSSLRLSLWFWQQCLWDRQGVQSQAHPFHKVSGGVHIRDGFVLVESKWAPQLLELPRKVVPTLHQNPTFNSLFLGDFEPVSLSKT